MIRNLSILVFCVFLASCQVQQKQSSYSEYKILQSHNVDDNHDLENKVNEAMKEGWVPIGGVSNDRMQAMAK
jgi:hypothetical protein